MIGVFLGSLLGAMAIGMPIAFALILSGVGLMIYLDMFDSQIIVQNLITGADSFPLMAIPFFILAGELMNAGGLSQRIISMASAVVGHVKGGLGYIAIIAGLLFASLSGSAVADTAAIGAILIPMMVKNGYDINRSSGLIATAGIIAPIIPPSIGFIMFGVIGGVSITKLFIAGIVPGLLMGIALVITWAIMVRKDKVQVQPRKSLIEIFHELRKGFWALLMPVIIIGGLKGGIFTPTEAAVVAVVYALFVGLFIYRGLNMRSLYYVMIRSTKITSVVMFLVCTALVSSWLMTIADLSGFVVRSLEPFMDNPTLLLIMINLLVIVVGTAMDMVPTILILTPVLLPVVEAAGIDPVYFGILFVINNAIGLLTPPVGVVLNVMAGVSRITMEDIIKGVWPFLLAEVIILILLILFPQLVLAPLEWML